jgi:hypothetical protein
MSFQRLGLLVCVAMAGLNAWLQKGTGTAVLDTPEGRWVLFGGTVVIAVLLWGGWSRGRGSPKT